MAEALQLPRRPGRPTGDRDLKPEILAAAQSAFAAYGFDAASLRQIAYAAKVSPAAILHHFRSKRGLYGEVLRQISDSLETHPVLTRQLAPGHESLRQVVDALVDWILDNDVFARIILREIMDNDERVQAARRWPMRKGMQVVYGAIGRSIGAARQDPIAELLSLQILGAAFLFYTGQATHRSQSSVEVDGWEERFRSLLIKAAACTLDEAAGPGTR